jgi:hypothetical protein
LSLVPDEILGGDPHVFETQAGVRQCFEAHEMTSPLHDHTFPSSFDHGAVDAMALRVAGHDHDDLGQRTVRAPELRAVQDEMRAVLGAFRDRAETRRGA